MFVPELRNKYTYISVLYKHFSIFFDTPMSNAMPEINKRIRQVIDFETNGNVKQFAELIGIAQQKVNRLFKKDSRTEKWPSVTTDILVKITEMFVNIDPDWLLLGNGKMFRGQNKDKTKQLFPLYKKNQEESTKLIEQASKSELQINLVTAINDIIDNRLEETNTLIYDFMNMVLRNRAIPEIQEELENIIASVKTEK